MFRHSSSSTLQLEQVLRQEGSVTRHARAYCEIQCLSRRLAESSRICSSSPVSSSRSRRSLATVRKSKVFHSGIYNHISRATPTTKCRLACRIVPRFNRERRSVLADVGDVCWRVAGNASGYYNSRRVQLNRAKRAEGTGLVLTRTNARFDRAECHLVSIPMISIRPCLHGPTSAPNWRFWRGRVTNRVGRRARIAWRRW